MNICKISLLGLVVLLVVACSPSPSNVVEVKEAAPIYPDYTDVTIPQNIAPLNFLVRGNGNNAEGQVTGVVVSVNGEEMAASNDGKVRFDLDDWHELLNTNAGKRLTVSVTAEVDGQWRHYQDFHWDVANDTIDPILTYRLIEPDYEVWNHLQIQQRDITCFETKQLGDHHVLENRCMNCHITGNQNPQLSMMYVRGKGGGAILNVNGHLRKLDLKAKNATDSMISSSVYYSFSPTGRYLTFSTNIIIPAFHSQARKRLEVYDTKSDVYVADLKENIIYQSPLLADTTQLETFPTFSPDGRYIYYCVADRRGLYGSDLTGLQYALVRIPFDEKSGRLGTKVDTLIAARPYEPGLKRSICHPKVSLDGRFIVYTVAAYGTFPIWHPEADLQMMDLRPGKTFGQINNSLAIVNSQKSDTYHSWSSNSRWLAFASKRDDGLYGKPYFTYIDRQGRAHKPFVLPQEDPTFYDNCLKSFNVPELCRGSLPFNAIDVEQAMKKNAEPFTLQQAR